LGSMIPLSEPGIPASRNEWDPPVLTPNNWKGWLPKDSTPDMLVHESLFTFVLVAAIPSRFASFDSFNSFNIA
jgi:hypothetical protein